MIFTKTTSLLWPKATKLLLTLQMIIVINLIYVRQGSLLDHDDEKRFLINTKGCTIPNFDVNNSKIMNYFTTEPTRAKCNKGYPPLVNSNSTSIFIMRQSMRFYGIVEKNLLKCFYAPLYRSEPKLGDTDKQITFGNSKPFSDFASIQNEEFIVVECFYKSVRIYRDFFSFVPLKTHTINDDGSFNVLLFGLDGISRLNFHRLMKETKSVLEEMQAIELFGYNKIGDNSFPNLMALLAGLSEDEMKRGCWPTIYDYFDRCTFIWNVFKERGYTTAFGEDSSWLGTFHDSKKGFKNQTTDYYWNYFNHISEYQTGNQANGNVWDCVGAREVYKVFLDYVTKFLSTMNQHKLKFFGYFFETIMSHDELMKPKLSDSTIAYFLKTTPVKSILNNTILIFFSDHGMRFGTFRKTYQGSIEERLPFIYIHVPEIFKEKYPSAYSNLLINQRRLVSPYDVHESLLDLSNPDVNINSTSKSERKHYSLFTIIPETRTCEEASIPPHYCTCYSSTELPINASITTELSSFVVEYINGLLNGTICKMLELDTILNARIQTPTDINLKSSNTSDFMVTIQTYPGAGQFEATIRVTEDNKSSRTKNVIGTISRINKYGNQSICVDDFHLRLYCYCP